MLEDAQLALNLALTQVKAVLDLRKTRHHAKLARIGAGLGAGGLHAWAAVTMLGSAHRRGESSGCQALMKAENSREKQARWA